MSDYISEQSNSNSITRRQAVAKIGVTAGAAGALASGLSACSKNSEDKEAQTAELKSKETAQAEKSESFLDASQLQTLEAICDTIIPTTDTPGAAATDTHGFINRFLPACASQDEIDMALHGIKRVEAFAQEKYSKPFHELSDEAQLLVLTVFDKKNEGLSDADKNGFDMLKTLTLKGYYTSEVGATKELKYNAIPGGYAPIKFSEVGRTWSMPV